MNDKATGGSGVGCSALLGEQRACATPLDDLLRRVPSDARMTYEHDPHSHSMIPVGRLCAEALAEIERLRALLRGECEVEYEELEDEHCMSFRIRPGSFNDMVRAIHRHGWDGALLFLPPNAKLTRHPKCGSTLGGRV